MSWRDSDVLWLLAMVPLLAGLPIFAFWRRRRAMERFGDEGTVRALVAGRSGPWRATRAVLWVLAIALTIVALAGPQWGSRTRVLRKRGIDVVIALDFSKSMLARDVRPSRIDRAKAEVVRFVEELDGDRVGVVAFAGETMEFPMTTDYAALALFLQDLGPYDMPVGGTAIARALTAAERLLERAGRRGGGAAEAPPEEGTQRSRVVILMTDGEDHEGNPVEVAQRLAENGVRVYVVGIGSRTGEPIPTYAPDGTWTGYLRDEQGQLVQTALTEDNERQLREIAEATGGRYFAAGRGGVGVDQIRAEMRQMHQDEQRTRRVTVQEDRYALLLFPAFLLFVLEALLPDAWTGRWRRRRTEAGR
ncbi:VWA domain-containing protein [Sandaracinus amylolyticus]|uniref:VWA domain-containing protein n=1 Tax=Sandaracinus amylolyticus TaxID=927083 RepID=UPI0012EE4822|nr:VWA domain-containing protein [Sandaracinus amylolyticus]